MFLKILDLNQKCSSLTVQRLIMRLGISYVGCHYRGQLANINQSFCWGDNKPSLMEGWHCCFQRTNWYSDSWLEAGARKLSNIMTPSMCIGEVRGEESCDTGQYISHSTTLNGKIFSKHKTLPQIWHSPLYYITLVEHDDCHNCHFWTQSTVTTGGGGGGGGFIS